MSCRFFHLTDHFAFSWKTQSSQIEKSQYNTQCVIRVDTLMQVDYYVIFMSKWSKTFCKTTTQLIPTISQYLSLLVESIMIKCSVLSKNISSITLQLHLKLINFSLHNFHPTKPIIFQSANYYQQIESIVIKYYVLSYSRLPICHHRISCISKLITVSSAQLLSDWSHNFRESANFHQQISPKMLYNVTVCKLHHPIEIESILIKYSVQS